MTNQELQLSALLQAEVSHTQNLLESLQLESAALVARDTTALEKVTQDKSGLVRQLESLGRQRESLIADIGGDPLGQNQQLADLWHELLEVATQCQQKNRINGGIIEVGFRQSQQALDILQGTTGKAELYNHSGQATRSAKSNPLAQV